MSTHRTWRRSLAAACWLVTGLLASGCDDTPTDAHRRDRVEVEAAIIAQVVGHSSFNQDARTVFVKSLTAAQEFDLAHQASVVEATKDVAEVIFIDTDDEAIRDGGITGDGVFVAIGAVTFGRSTAQVRYDEIFPERPTVRWTATLTKVGERWSLSGPPVTVP